MKKINFIKSLVVLLTLLLSITYAWGATYSSTPLVSLDFSSNLPTVSGVTYNGASYSSGKISWGGNFSSGSRDVTIQFTTTGAKFKVVIGHITSGSSMTFKYLLDNGSATNMTLTKSGTSDNFEISAAAGSHTIHLGPGGSSTRTVVTSIAIYDTISSGNTLTYNSNGGSGSMSNTTGSGSVTLRTNTFTKTGCTFYGWATSQANANAGTRAYTDGASYTLSADATLYAIWKLDAPTISCTNNIITMSEPGGATVYYTTDGSTTPTSSSTAYNSSSKPSIAANTTFKAIAIKANHISSNVTTYNATYVAPTYTLTASAAVINPMTEDSKTGAITGSFTNNPVSSIPSGTSTSTSTNTFTVNGTTVTAAATIAGTSEQCDECTYRFDSWENIPATVTADVSTIHAKYNTTYSITYNKNSGDWVGGYSAPAYYVYGTGATLPTDENIERDGYTFDGWTLSGDAADLSSGWGNVILDANWTEDSGNTLTYNSNGGSGSMSNTTGTGSVTLRTNTFTKAGCSFAGWATSQANANAGTVAYDDGDSYTLSADATLYAVWKVNTPAISSSDIAGTPEVTTTEFTVPSGATLYYTTDGTDPTSSSTTYDAENGIDVSGSATTIKIRAIRANHIPSDVLTVPFYQLNLHCTTGTCTPSAPYVAVGYSYQIYSTGSNGYSFDGWSTTSGAGTFGSTSSNLTTYTMTSNGATIYATWSCAEPVFGTNLSTSQVDYSVGAAASALTVAATAANSGTVTYQWYSNDENNYDTPTTLTNCTTATYTPLTASEGTTYYFCVATNTSGGNCTTNSNIAKIVVSTVSYTLTYALGGASGAQSGGSAAGSYAEGATITVPAKGTLAKSGYTFCGWSDGTTMYVAGQTFTITANTTLTAIWDGTGSSSTLTHFGTQFKTNTPRRGYAYAGSTSGTKFIYETDDSNCKNIDSDSSAIRLSNSKYMRIYNSGATPSNLADSTFTGVTSISFKWKLFNTNNNVTCSFDVYVGGTKIETASLTGKSGDGFATKTISVATKTGTVRFYNGGSSSSYGLHLDDITISCGTPSTAKTVTFDKGGKSGATGMPAAVKVPSGSKIAAPTEIPTVSGYIFDGWVTTSGGSTAFDFANTTITGNTTIYAKWVAKTTPTQYAVSGDNYYCPGETATITLANSQSGINYQLLKGGSASGDPKAGTGSALEWEVNATGTYTVKALENATYSEREMSGSVTVASYVTTAINTQPVTSVSAGASVNFTLGQGMGIAGNNLEFQWYTCNSDGSSPSAVGGATSSTYTTSKSAGTYYYKAGATGSCGSTVYSNVITVTVKNTPTVYTVSGTTSICSGETATITLADSEDGIEYQLLKGGVAEGDPVDGTGDALEWEVSAAGTYTVKTVETSTYAEATMSSSAVITVNAVTAFTTNLPTSTKYINANASYTYTIAASGTSLSYQWYTCNSDGTGKVAMSDKTTASMTYTFTNSDAPTKYVCCVVTGTCGTITSNVQPVNITPTYYLTINLNGGSGGGISSGNRPAGNFTIANSSTIPTKSGYVFLGWKFSTNNVIYQPGATVTMPSAAATLTAQWASEEFKFSKGTKGTEPTDGFVITPDNINSSAFTAGATLTGGTMTNTSGATLGINASYGFVMIKNTRSISVALSSGAFQAGTVIYLEGYTNKNSTAYTYGFSVSGNAAGSPVSETTNAYVAFKQRYVVTAGDGIAGTSSFTLTFNSSATGTQAYLSLIAIGNCLSCTTISPTLTYSATTLYAFGGTPGTATPTLNKDGNTGAVTWSSSNTSVVTVDASGNITAVGAGSATITAELTYDGVRCGGIASCDITVPALVTQTLNVASSTAWGTTPALTFTPSDKGMEQVLRLTKNTFTFDSTSTSTKQDGTSKRWMTASFTGSETTKGKYLKMAFKNTQHNLRLGEVVVPIQPISSNGSAQVEIYEGSTLRMTSTAVTGITAGSLADVHFTFASPYVFAAGSTINVYIYFYGQTNGFRLASPILISGAVLTDYEYTTAGNWSTAANWNWGKLPLAGDNVVLQKPVTVDNTDAVANNVVIDKSGGNTGKLTIAADGMLIAAGTIRANGDAQTAVEDVIINCSKTSQGALIFNNPSGSKQTKGTVNFYTRSYRDNTSKKLQWQYVGIPFDDVTDEVYGGLYVNKYSETAGSWTVMRYQGDRSISAWDGLALAGDEEGYACLQGTFTSTADKAITLTHSAAAGENLIGNSWTAPIQIADLAESDFDGATATIYLFNTGRYKTSEGSGSSTESGTKEHTAGQWMTIPISSAASGVWAGMKVIPAFNAFEVITSSEATLSLDYSKVVASATNDVNAEMRAPARRTSAKDIDGYRLRVADELTYTDMYLFEDITFTTGHDNGWDGNYMPCDGRSAQLYAQTALGKLAVAALPDLEGTVLGFKPGQSTEYTFSFGTNAGGYYLNDLKMQESTLIQEGNTYTFTWEDGDSTNRFIISATPYKMPTGVDDVQGDKVQSDKVRKVLIDDHLYIIRAGKIFNATGSRVK